MDNVTHSFVGAAIAECVVPRDASPRTRTVLIGTGIVAANAPDVDLLYSSITEAPLGYLLHHRGHSHTLPGLMALAFVIWMATRLLPRVSPALRGTGRAVLLLIAAGLVSHLLMDTANSYGTHLFYPFSARWVYGDAVFVLEPWFWILLGTALALNAGRIGRLAVAVPPLVLIGVLAYMGLLRTGVLLAMGSVVAAGAVAMRSWERSQRASLGLAAAATIFAVMPAVSSVAKSEARRAAGSLESAEVVDIVADANPGMPWCWTTQTAQLDRQADMMVVRSATLSLLPGIWPAASCTSARMMTQDPGAASSGSASLVWHATWRTDLGQLRALSATDCRVRAWLQFGRLPHVANGAIVDLRFERPVGQNFTRMAVARGADECPRYVTSWERPRRDVLGQSSDNP